MMFFAGSLIKYVPEPVLAGLMTGIGIKLLDNQIPEILGYDYKVAELAQMFHRPDWLHEVSWHAVLCGLLVAFMTVIFKPYKRFPASLVGISLVTFLAVYLGWDLKSVGKIGEIVPSFSIPELASNQWVSLIIKCIPLGLLAAVESLLAAQVIDHMSKSKKLHNSNLELLAQGLANICSGLFKGMPVTGVVVRSTVNIQSGAKTKVAALTHSLILLFCVLYLTDAIEVVPLAGLAGLLCVVGFRLIEVKTLVHIFKDSKLHALAFLAVAIGTITNYMMMGLIAGGFFALVHYLIFERNKEREQSKQSNSELNLTKKTDGDNKSNWLKQISAKAHIATTAFVHGQASVIGRVVLGSNVHIAAGSSVRADEGSPFYIGDNTNIQDGVVIHALKDKWITVKDQDWAVYIGNHVSLAHQALVHGPCFIGSETFIGFKAVVHDSIVGSNCYIGIGAVVVGVEIPDRKFVPNGMVVDTLEKVDQLPDVTHSHQHFNEDVVEVNRGLAKAYLNFFAEEEKAEVKKQYIESKQNDVDRF
jgi:SulP family sulfate permease